MRTISILSFAVVLAALLTEGCTPGKARPIIPSRTVPPPLELSGKSLINDSTVRTQWLCRQEVMDPLAPLEGGTPITISAVLYGRDMVRAEAIAACNDTATVGPPDSVCINTWEQKYTKQHDLNTRFRIRLDMRSTFSVNSLQAKFWNFYIRTEDDISFEPRTISEREPVVVRQDSMPRPGRRAARPGLYTRTIDLYFDLSSLGVETLGTQTEDVRLFMAHNHKDVASFTWMISGENHGRARRVKRRSQTSGNPDF
jgi:hypothetical protein